MSILFPEKKATANGTYPISAGTENLRAWSEWPIGSHCATGRAITKGGPL
jgi:hypothetical protein